MSDDDDRLARAKRFDELKRAEASKLGRSVDDATVIHIAALRMQSESLQAMLVNGDVINTTELIALSEKITELTPPEPLKVDVAYVHGVSECCGCGHTQPFDEDRIEKEIKNRLALLLAQRAVEPVPLRLLPGPTGKPFTRDGGKPVTAPSTTVEGEVLPPQPPPKPDFSPPVDHSKSPHYPGGRSDGVIAVRRRDDADSALRSCPGDADATSKMVLAQSLGYEDCPPPREKEGHRRPGETAGRDHAPHLG